MEEQWGVYMTTVDNMPASIVVNLHVEQQHRLNYPFCHFMRVELQTADGSGLPEQRELEVLHMLFEPMLEQHAPVFVGTITTNGMRDFIFYTAQKEEHALHKSLQEAFATQHYDVTSGYVEDEANWAFYDNVLYPNIYERQYIKNDEMTERLRELGDDGSIPRVIHHSITFPTAEARQQFEATARTHDFSAVEATDDAETSDYHIVIERIDMLDLEAIDTLTYFLIHLAEQFGGTYDGWGSDVVKKQH